MTCVELVLVLSYDVSVGPLRIGAVKTTANPLARRLYKWCPLHVCALLQSVLFPKKNKYAGIRLRSKNYCYLLHNAGKPPVLRARLHVPGGVHPAEPRGPRGLRSSLPRGAHS